MKYEIVLDGSHAFPKELVIKKITDRRTIPMKHSKRMIRICQGYLTKIHISMDLDKVINLMDLKTECSTHEKTLKKIRKSIIKCSRPFAALFNDFMLQPTAHTLSKDDQLFCLEWRKFLNEKRPTYYMTMKNELDKARKVLLGHLIRQGKFCSETKPASKALETGHGVPISSLVHPD